MIAIRALGGLVASAARWNVRVVGLLAVSHDTGGS